ncbi:MAG: hypothetical protein ABSE63_05465 [Thermoguttaceae bacterium]|jgi:hypothetical protein
MARKKGIRIVLLVEDRMLERFARAILVKLGFNSRDFRLIPYPVGTNTKQWVTQQYPIEIKTYRQKVNYQPNIALLVGTEADEQTVIQRNNYLSASLQVADIAPRQVQESIVLWVPKWHVETWILFLSGQNVNEDQSYKHDVNNPDFGLVANKFADKYREFQSDSNINVLPSLKNAFQETMRLNN